MDAENPQIQSQMKVGRLTSEDVASYAATLGDEALLSLVRTVFPASTAACALDRIWVELPLRRPQDRVRLAVLACARIGRPDLVPPERRELDLALSRALFDIAVRPSLGLPGTDRAVSDLVSRLWQDQAHGRELLLSIIRRPEPLRLPPSAWRQLILAKAAEEHGAGQTPADHGGPLDSPDPLTGGRRVASLESGPGLMMPFESRTGPDERRRTSWPAVTTVLVLTAVAVVVATLFRLLL